MSLVAAPFDSLAENDRYTERILSCLSRQDDAPDPRHRGMLLALPVASTRPEFAGVALVAGFVGGVVPDLDLYAGHRRTLHQPVYHSVLAAVALGLSVALPTVPTAAAFVLVGAAAHSLVDALKSGLEPRPWEATSDRTVYDHYNRRWIAPARWVRYDGSPGDFLLSAALAAPLLVMPETPVRRLVVGILVVAAVYAVVRRGLSAVAVLLVGRVLEPLAPGVLAYVPARYRSAPDAASRR